MFQLILIFYNLLQIQHFLMSKKQSDNYLLSKTQLGKIPAGFHKLPPQNHTYGKAPIKDQYGARQVISGWAQHEPSKVSQPGNDYIAMNRQGIKSGCTDSKGIMDYRKNHQIKMKVKQGQKYYGVNIPNEQFTYGIPNRPSTPIKNVICNTYGAQQQKLKQQKEAVLAMLEKDSKKKPVVEKSPKKINEQVNKKKIVEQNNFKLAKFKNVQSKIKPMIEKNSK